MNGSFNAVFIEGGAAGDLMLYGRGAGGRPTASAVLGDLIDAAANLRRGSAPGIGVLERALIAPIDDVTSAYYLNLEVDVVARYVERLLAAGTPPTGLTLDGLRDMGY